MSSHAPDAPFGTWTSPIHTDDLLQGALGLANPRTFGGEVFWMESRPAEAGRTTIMRRRTDGTLQECVPAPLNARTRVHEYGGICYVVHEGILYFANFSDQRVYRVALDQDTAPAALTAADGTRWADFEIDAGRERLIAVGERDQNGTEPRNFVAAIALANGATEELTAGHDFYAAPRLSGSGDELIWLQWDHPSMPWDGTDLIRAGLDAEGRVETTRHVAGGAEESIFQPEWMPDGALVFVSDRSGFWNLYIDEAGGPRCLLERDADFGLPMWVFGMRTWVPLDATSLACVWHDADRERLGVLNLANGALTQVDLPWTAIDGLAALGSSLALVGASPDRFAELVVRDVDGGTEVLRVSTTLALDPADLAVPEAIRFPTGTDGNAEAYAFFYPPAHRDCHGAAEERPPLVVIGHGGPTAATAPVLNLKIQFWTSRGFAVLDVNYRGSTGLGRAYRDALKGGWGVIDVQDCVAGARFLAERGDVDAQRMAIRGSSAGGLTVLNALIFHDVFRAGASLYGVADLGALAADTHKFESRYLDSLVGPWPEAKDVYDARSPVHQAAGLDCPVIFLQGLDDRIVPPSQPEAMIAELDARGVPNAYVTFEGEQHGFRQAPNIKRALDAELYFYGQVFGFEPAGKLEPVPIRNLPKP